MPTNTFLEEEIYSQPKVLSSLLEWELERVEGITGEIPEFNYVVIAARGSSDHAATYAQYVWSSLAGFPVALATPSLYTLYQTPPRLDGALVVGVSQSGQSPDIVAVLEEGRRQGRPTLAITNAPDSPLANTADWVIPIHAGPERSVAATKTYTAQLLVMALLGALWSGSRTHLEEVKQIPAAVARALEISDEVSRRAERYRFMEQCVVIGRGFNYATAFELALKLKELTYVMATAYSSADFRHGPIATVHQGLPVILIMPSGRAFGDVLELARDLHSYGAELLVISDSKDAKGLANVYCPLPEGVPEWLSPIVSILPGQLLSLHLAQVKGLDPDSPRGLTKVTRTR